MFCALETPRAMIADVRMSVHVGFRCWSMFMLWRLEACGAKFDVLEGNDLLSHSSSAESQSSQGHR